MGCIGSKDRYLLKRTCLIDSDRLQNYKRRLEQSIWIKSIFRLYEGFITETKCGPIQKRKS